MKYVKWLVILALAGAILLVGPYYINYAKGRDAVPAGVTLAGLSIGGASTEEAVANLRAVFERPILVFHGDNPIVLRPEEIDFEVDAEAMVAEAQERGKGWYAIWDFLFYVMQKPPIGVDVPLKYHYDPQKLADWIETQSQKYDHEPLEPTVNLETLSFSKGRPGVRTDPSETAINIINGFTDPYNREAHFALIVEEAGKPDFSALETAMRQRFEKFPGVYASYFQFLPTGEEIDIDADTAFSGMSTVKLGILLLTYMDNDLPLPDNITQWISITITSPTASNAAANALMYHLGDGDLMKGVRRVSQFYQDFGLKNTFISTPYNSEVIPPMKRTPANTNPEYNTNLDPAMQTTPRDMGVLLAEIGRCAEGKGSLLAAYPISSRPRNVRSSSGGWSRTPWAISSNMACPRGQRSAISTATRPTLRAISPSSTGPKALTYSLSTCISTAGWCGI